MSLYSEWACHWKRTKTRTPPGSLSQVLKGGDSHKWQGHKAIFLLRPLLMQDKLEGFQSNRRHVTTSLFLWYRMTHILPRCSLQNRSGHIPKLHQNWALARYERGHPGLVRLECLQYILCAPGSANTHPIFLLWKSITCAVQQNWMAANIYPPLVFPWLLK